MKQILLNLLSNALKFTHRRRHDSARAHVRADATVAIAVADTGIGIAPDDQEKIFEDFRQVDNSPTRAYGGTGLGLSICRRLAQMLGGRITVESEIGQRSTFTLTLPAERTDDDTSKTERPRVLVVDDYPGRARDVRASTCEFSGFDVAEAGNGKEALAAGRRSLRRTSS